ncbi:MAG: DciA family protein [Steroidobacteraceae bacterium]
MRSLNEILSSTQSRNDAQLAVAQGADGLSESRAWLCSFLPEELATHVLHALERNGELVVFTESSAWAGRLTLTLAESRASLAPRLAPEARVVVRVVPGGRYRR